MKSRQGGFHISLRGIRGQLVDDIGLLAASTSHEISSEFVNIGISLGYGSLATLDDCCIGFARKYLFQDATDAEDVVADVCLLGYNLFWRDVCLLYTSPSPRD